MRAFAQEQDITILQEGICHQVMPERGYVVPGSIIVGADSHSCTYGALGSFATGMGSTDIGVAYATGRAWFRIPQTINVRLEGELPPGVYTKDVSLEIVRHLGVDGANYRAIEYSGSFVDSISVSERFTLCNMAIEMGGKVGLIAPDETTRAWLRGRTEQEYPMLAPRQPRYERVVEIDVANLEPLIACPPDVNNLMPVSEVEHVEIDQVFLGTCTNGRLDDLAIAAGILMAELSIPARAWWSFRPHARCILRRCGWATWKSSRGRARRLARPAVAPALGGISASWLPASAR